MRWNVDKIFEEFGGANDMCAALVADGHDINVRAVRQWKRRGNIPPDWIAALLALRGQDPCGWLQHPKPAAADASPEMEDIF